MVLVQGHDEDMQHPLWLEILRTSYDHQNVLSHHQTSTAAHKKMVKYSSVQGDDELQLMDLVHSALLTRQCYLQLHVTSLMGFQLKWVETLSHSYLHQVLLQF